MGLIGRAVSWVLASGRPVPGRQVLVALGQLERVTADVYPPLNIDAQGVPGDLPYCASASGTGRRVALGWLEQSAQQLANPGEIRLYSRTPDGTMVEATVWLESDGRVLVENRQAVFQLAPDGVIEGANSNGEFRLELGGDFVANGARMTTDGDVQTSDGISLRNHTHAQGPDSAGDTQVPTNPPS